MTERQAKTVVVLNARMTDNSPRQTYDILTAGELINALRGVSSDTPVYIGTGYGGDYGWRAYGPVRSDDVYEAQYYPDTEDVLTAGNL